MGSKRDAFIGSPRRWLGRAMVVAMAVGGTAVAVAAPAQAAITGTRPIQDVFNVQPFSDGFGAVQCDPGEKVLGGGIDFPSFDTRVRVFESQAVSDIKWVWSVHNPTNMVEQVTGRAICATNVPGYARPPAKVQGLPPSSSMSVGVPCPPGTLPISGGFVIRASPPDRDQIKVGGSFPLLSFWDVQVRNDSLGFYDYLAQVICATPTGRTTPNVTLTIGPGGFRSTFKDCPANAWLVGGGWLTTQDVPTSVVTAALPFDGRWHVNLANPDSVPYTVNSMAICMPR